MREPSVALTEGRRSVERVSQNQPETGTET